MPRNGKTGDRYSVINILILWDAVFANGCSTNSFLTFRQALALGGKVRKGERGTTVFYAHRFTPDSKRRRASEDGREPGSIPFLKRYTVFSTDQCEGLPDRIAAPPPPVPEGPIRPEAEAMIHAPAADFRNGSSEQRRVGKQGDSTVQPS